ncbi:MAG: hypothetical protein Q8O00_06545 [Holophaga sp.]|nr:hypothetical protein [Holophaga sp.]
MASHTLRQMLLVIPIAFCAASTLVAGLQAESKSRLQTVVKVKVLAAERGDAPEEEWIRREMQAMQIPKGVGSGSQWITLGKEPVTIQSSRYFGQVFLAVLDPGGESPLRLEITGARPLTIEIPRAPGTKKIVPYTTATVPTSIDYFFAIEVEAK